MAKQHIKNQFIVIGAGRFGTSLATTLHEMGRDVLVVDSNPSAIEALSNRVTHAVQADATDANVLEALDIRSFDVAIICIGDNLQSSILISLMCKDFGVPTVIAKAQNDIHARVLSKIGVDQIIFPERDMGARLARNLLSNHIMDFIELSDDYSLVELAVIPGWIDKSLRQLDMRVRYNVTVMAIRHDGKLKINPTGDDILHDGDVLIVIGSNEALHKIQ